MTNRDLDDLVAELNAPARKAKKRTDGRTDGATTVPRAGESLMDARRRLDRSGLLITECSRRSVRSVSAGRSESQRRLLLVDAAIPLVHSGPCIEALYDEENSDDLALVTCSACLARRARVKPLTWSQTRRAKEIA